MLHVSMPSGGAPRTKRHWSCGATETGKEIFFLFILSAKNLAWRNAGVHNILFMALAEQTRNFSMLLTCSYT